MTGGAGPVGLHPGRQVKAGGGGRVLVLGAWRLPDRALLAARVGAVDVVIDLRPEGTSGAAKYRTMRGMDVRVFRHPSEPGPGRVENLAVDWLVVRFLDRKPLPDGALPAVANPRAEDVPPAVPLPAGMRDAGVTRLENALETCVEGPEPGAKARIRWVHGQGERSFLGWAAEGERTGTWEAGAAASLDLWATGVAAALSSMLGPGARWEAEAPTVTLFVNLAHPVTEGFARFAEPPPSRIAVHTIVPSRCLLRCSFCPGAVDPDDPIPTRGTYEMRVERLTSVLAGVVGRGIPVDLVLVGDDALNVEDPVGMLRRLTRFGPSHVRIVTPGTGLHDPALARALAGLQPPPGLTLTLLGPDEDLHDRLAGRAGAFRELESSIANCRDAGLDVQLNLVVVRDNAAVLPQTLRHAAALGVPVRLVMFRSEPRHGREFLQANVPCPAEVVRALTAVPPGVAEAVIEVVDVPLCLLPPSLRGKGVFTQASLPDEAGRRPSACARCPAAGTRCTGPSRGMIDLFGEEGLHPVPG